MLRRTQHVIKRGGLFVGALKRVLLTRVKTGRPFFISHLITSRCFARCPTCLWRGNAPEQEDTAKIIQFYQQARQAGFVSTTFWGGEPLLRKDIIIILQACQELGIVTGLITNGFLLPQYADKLARRLQFLIVSLDFPSEMHDHYRGVTGLFNNAITGINMVKKANPKLKIFINSVINKLNYPYVPGLIQLAEELDTTITFESVNTGAPQFDRADNNNVVNLRLDRKMEQKVFSGMQNLKKQHRCINNSFHYLEMLASGNVQYRCHARKISIRVEPDGSVTNCLDRENSPGNVYRENLNDILMNQKIKQLQKKAEKCNACVDSGVIESSLFWDFDIRVMFDMFRLFLR